ncbi:hypothetical protein N7539_005021 [Penicillium diatomitis]|uniref:U-box domain-containing protein n=1 Tax=Penicillium diatomitis TaxID=2819901 RepID=A0A9W9X663_9EURO|nr:uncharacterized protein N7539_005021 [Penicillium diatomitis]KAJ5485033.1 hypothetical protein N7539_005021 [Penicillium diatomitis]
MSDTLSDAEKIRNKRLAKLQAPAASTAPAAEPSHSPSSSTSPSRASSPGPSSQSHDTVSEAPAAAPGSQMPEGKRIKITPTTSAEVVERARSIPQSPARTASPARINSPARVDSPARSIALSIDEFEHLILGSFFSINLNEETRARNKHRADLPGLRSELLEDGKEVRLHIGILDQAILEAASQAQRPLDYLLPCWNRIQDRMRKPDTDTKRWDIICEAKRLCLSYCVFAITMPEMFGVESSNESPLARQLLLSPDDGMRRGITPEFLREVSGKFEDDDSLKPALISAVEELSSQLALKDANGEIQPYMMAMRNLVENPAIAAAMTESSLFNVAATPPTFETTTLLGPWYRLSPLQPKVTMSYFSTPKTRDQGFIVNSQSSLRMMQNMIQGDLDYITTKILRASPEAKNRFLDWVATALNLNHKRRAMQVKPEEVASDGFMFNLTSTLDKLCGPIMNIDFRKIHTFHAEYFQRNPRIDMRDETKINADQHASEAFYSKTMEGNSNFNSELFFLTIAAHHYGSESLTSRLEQLDKDLRHIESSITRFEAERPRWAANPAQLRVYEQALKKYRDKLDLGLALKYSLQALLLDEQWQVRSIEVMRHVAVWLLRVASGKDFPQEKITLPLPEQQPEVFQNLPEYFLDVIISNFKFVTWAMPQTITAVLGEELVMLCITFLESSSYIKNPYLKAGLVSMLFRGTLTRPGGHRGVLVDLLNSMPFANEYLLHAIMKFYIEAEHTGAHTQFFDKFNIRYEIFQIIKCIWPNTLYRKKLSNQATQNQDFFVQFVNLLLNDVTYVLGESFSAFKTIRSIQEELRREGESMDPTARQEKEEHLTSSQRNAKSYMQLTNETMAMLKLFTAALADSFTMPEIVQRLADMLNYNLDAMAGPKSSQLKVEGNVQLMVEKYGFDPKVLLSDIAKIYVNLMNKPNFITAVARDGRSYRPELFKQASDLLRQHQLTPEEDLRRWDRLRKEVQEAKEADDQAEEDLGEIPDDFLDPLMYTLMEDPVILPSSKVSIDRSTIRSHLLSDPHDPFNRMPLKMEDVLPDTELKAKIEAFKAERKGMKKTMSDQMDTTAD